MHPTLLAWNRNLIASNFAYSLLRVREERTSFHPTRSFDSDKAQDIGQEGGQAGAGAAPGPIFDKRGYGAERARSVRARVDGEDPKRSRRRRKG